MTLTILTLLLSLAASPQQQRQQSQQLLPPHHSQQGARLRQSVRQWQWQSNLVSTMVRLLPLITSMATQRWTHRRLQRLVQQWMP